jgi:hypothetical protein
VPTSLDPTTIPSLQPQRLRQQFVNVTVPIGFLVDLMLRNTNTDDEKTSALNRTARIWEESLLSYFSGAFAGRPGIRPLSVHLTVTEQQQQSRHRSLRYDWLRRNREEQESTEAVTVKTIGDVNFAVDEMSVEPNAFVERAKEELPTVLNANQLQTAIDDAGASNDVTIVSEIATLPSATEPDVNENDNNNKSPSAKNRPSNAEIVLGFTLLVLTIASLMFWASVLWKKRKKRLRQQKLESLRKMQSVTYQSPAVDQSLTAATITTREGTGSPQHTPSLPYRSGIATTVMPTSGVVQGTSTYDSTIVCDDATNEESDPFARELQRAASFDRAAWEEFERNKKLESGKSRSIPNSVPGVARSSNVSMYSTIGDSSQDMGIEVEPRRGGSFPYGDENHNQSKVPIHLNAENAVKWTAAGISLASLSNHGNSGNRKNKAANFSPYGDRAGRSLQESWDLDEFPVKDESGPSQFSFLYPLKRRDLNADVPDARRSPDSDSSVRGDSLEVTSVGTPDYANHGNIREVRNENDNDSESDNASQSALTALMLKELEEISNYVRQYEQLKRSRTSTQRGIEQGQEDNVGKIFEASNDSYGTHPMKEIEPSEGKRRKNNVPSELPVVPKTGMSKARYTMSAMLSPARSNDSSLGLSDEEDEDDTASQISQRLGISRISVEKPSTTPLLTYKNSQDDPLQWDMDTADISPFPSSDIDSLRYSPSQSFEKLVTINFAKESLLDGAIPTYKSTLTEESDDGENPLPVVSANDVVISSTAENPSKTTEMLGFLRRGINTRRTTLLPDSEIAEELEPRLSPRVRSTDRKYNTIRSIFESKRTLPIVPPNESVRNFDSERTS